MSRCPRRARSRPIPSRRRPTRASPSIRWSSTATPRCSRTTPSTASASIASPSRWRLERHCPSDSPAGSRPRGFPNDAFNNDVAYNGSFMNSSYIPSFGYPEGRELGDDDIREAQQAQAQAADEEHRRSGGAPEQLSHAGRGLDHVRRDDVHRGRPDFHRSRVLGREWTENRRRCFHYKMDRPILDFYATLGAIRVKRNTRASS